MDRLSSPTLRSAVWAARYPLAWRKMMEHWHVEGYYQQVGVECGHGFQIKNCRVGMRNVSVCGFRCLGVNVEVVSRGEVSPNLGRLDGRRNRFCFFEDKGDLSGYRLRRNATG